MAALIRQANSWHKMKEIKQLKPPQNPKRLPTCKHKVDKKQQQTNKKQITSLIDNKGVDDYSHKSTEQK